MYTMSADNCFYNGQARHYQGRVSVTSNLYICQRWDVQTPHRHSYNKNDFPDDTIPNNFCRTTKDSSRPWCYTTDRKQRWERCSVNSCNCPAGRFGHNCNKVCHCQDPTEQCDSIMGMCQSGCVGGWEGFDCQSRCPAGFYGADCRKNCSANCAEKERSGAPICKFSDGSCNFCDNGWYGDRCDVPCNTNCLMSGGVHACHQQDGTCESCKGYKYGPSCNLDCAQNCLDCEKVDGHCLSCQPGYHGNFCDGKCNEHCGTEDDNDVKVGLCDRNTSLCLHGCTNGWYNNTCLDKCNSKCRGEKCNIDNGKCSDGCVSGYRGDFCDLPANVVTVVGFTATFGRERHLANIGESEIIVFDSVTSNVGLGYNVATGIFRAPVSGVYVFNVGIVVGPLKLADLLIIQAPESGSISVDRGHVLADSSNVNKRSTGSRNIVLNLNLGDQVWVRNGLSATIELHGNGLSSFSGYLLAPISH